MQIGRMEKLGERWVDGRPDLRWSSTGGTGPPEARASGTSLLEVPPGCALPRHTDSAEEIVVVVAGTAEVEVAGERTALEAGGVALVPEGMVHQVANAGHDPLRFVAVYAGVDVETRYEHPVQPDGDAVQQTIG